MRRRVSLTGAPVLRIIAAATLAASAGILCPPPAQALPPGERTCRVITYYSSAAKTREVGVFTMCPGGAKLGHKTQWFTSETFTTGHPNPIGNPTQPANLPCEFLVSGCSNTLPEPR